MEMPSGLRRLEMEVVVFDAGWEKDNIGSDYQLLL